MLNVAPTEPPSLRALGDVTSMPEKYGADVIFSAHGMFGGVQRKEFSDLIASVVDGRLTREVILMQELEWRLLIVEGRPNWTTDGLWLREYGQASWSKAQVRGLLWSIAAKDIWVTTTDNLTDTIETVTQFVAWCRKEQHNSLDRRPSASSPFGRVTERDRQIYMLQSLDHVGPILASQIIDKFGLPFKWRITWEDLLSMPRVKEKKAEAIWRQMPTE